MAAPRPSPDLIVTGFRPFPGMRINPSAALAEALARRLNRSGSRRASACAQ